MDDSLLLLDAGAIVLHLIAGTHTHTHAGHNVMATRTFTVVASR